MACAHARVTCGGWDGASCKDHVARSTRGEEAALAEYRSIDVDARAICPEGDESAQAYKGLVGEVIHAVDAAIGQADAVDQRLAKLRESQPTPGWEVLTLARAGSVYDCIWTSLRAAKPQLFTPKQQALLLKLQGIPQGLSAAGQLQQTSQIQQQVAGIQALVQEKWNYTSGQYLTAVAGKLVPRYVRAHVLARRYAMEGFGLLRASWRLPVVASVLGDAAMAEIVEAMPDPTAPEGTKGRQLHYARDLFAVAP
jgi:hypothetical protein